jgi:hypothetical protein
MTRLTQKPKFPTCCANAGFWLLDLARLRPDESSSANLPFGDHGHKEPCLRKMKELAQGLM